MGCLGLDVLMRGRSATLVVGRMGFHKARIRANMMSTLSPQGTKRGKTQICQFVAPLRPTLFWPQIGCQLSAGLDRGNFESRASQKRSRAQQLGPALLQITQSAQHSRVRTLPTNRAVVRKALAVPLLLVRNIRNSMHATQMLRLPKLPCPHLWVMLDSLRSPVGDVGLSSKSATGAASTHPLSLRRQRHPMLPCSEGVLCKDSLPAGAGAQLGLAGAIVAQAQLPRRDGNAGSATSDECEAVKPDRSVLFQEVSRWSQAGSRACLLPHGNVVIGPEHQSAALTSLRLLVDMQRPHQPPRPSTLHNCRCLRACLPQQVHTLCPLVRAEHHLRALGSAQQCCRANTRGARRYGLLDSHGTSHSSDGSTLWFCAMGWLAAFSFWGCMFHRRAS